MIEINLSKNTLAETQNEWVAIYRTNGEIFAGFGETKEKAIDHLLKQLPLKIMLEVSDTKNTKGENNE